jgi:protein-S-isoprenylcysteine O-methyltransferase Ste14
MGANVSVWRHLRAVLMPAAITIVVPIAIVWWTGDVRIGWGLDAAARAIPVVVGVVVLVLGVVLIVRTVALFVVVGRGTLAPWDPTTRLVAVGPYRHVRNPMISGVAFVLAGEACTLGSTALALWFVSVVAVNAVYLPLVEEAGLRERFGEEYDEYRANVPRWIPRVRPWSP